MVTLSAWFNIIMHHCMINVACLGQEERPQDRGQDYTTKYAWLAYCFQLLLAHNWSKKIHVHIVHALVSQVHDSVRTDLASYTIMTIPHIDKLVHKFNYFH